MTHFGIDPVAIDFGIIQIHWYGLMYVFGFFGGYALAIYRIGRGLFPINREQMSDLLTWIALGVVLGGRAGYMIFYQPERLLDEPLSLFFIWEGGMAFHGGLIGVIAFTWIFARRHQIAPLALGDALVPLIPVGLGFGRLGNFIGGELWGRPTDMDWGMVFSRADTLPRHPSQLYQFALEGLLLFAILWVFSAKSRPSGQVTGLFLLGYGVFRFAVEFVREPDAHLGFVWLSWMTMGQLLSIPMIAIGYWLLMLRKGTLNARIS